MNIDSKQLQKSLDYIKKANSSPLSEIEIDGVKLIDIVGNDAIDDWRFVGLSNCSFFEYSDSVSAILSTKQRSGAIIDNKTNVPTSDYQEFADWYCKELKYMEASYPMTTMLASESMTSIEYAAWKAWQAARR